MIMKFLSYYYSSCIECFFFIRCCCQCIKARYLSCLYVISFLLSLSYSWSEVEYFERWYKYKDTEERAAVKALVTSGQFEFLLGGWSLFEPEGVYQDDLINQYEESQRLLYEEFGYRCPVAYLQPSYRVYRNLASILHDSGIEMLLLNGADNTIYNDLLSKKSVEFLWETSPFSTFESRLFTHISSSTSSSLWSVIKQVLNEYSFLILSFDI